MAMVTVLLGPRSPEDLAAMERAVRGQDFTGWECHALPRGDGAAVRTHLEHGAGDFVLICESGTRLRPGALGTLVDVARRTGAHGVVGGYRFVGPLGELPWREGEERASAISQVPLGAVLVRREVAARAGWDASLGEAAGRAWLGTLERCGAVFQRVEEVVADVELRPLASAKEVLGAARRHARAEVGVCVGAGGCGEDSGLEEAERRMEQLVEFTRDPSAWMHPGMAMPWRFAQWWYRLGFHGPAPVHLLDESSPPAPELLAMRDRPMVDIFVASYKRPDRLAAMVASVRATGYPARVCVAAGDLETVRVCEGLGEGVECVYSTAANRLTGCTAPLNHVVASLVRHDAIFCTDDCVFAPDSIGVAVRSLYSAYPDGDGVVGLAQENIPNGYELAFPLIGQRFRERFQRELFFPGYFHMYNDAELGITVKCLGNWHFEPRATLRHFHPCTGVAEDHTHTRGRTFGQKDARLWHERRMAGSVWGIDASE
jgi:hypothetical protein